jgi:Na+/H+ antiporter NhaB
LVFLFSSFVLLTFIVALLSGSLERHWIRSTALALVVGVVAAVLFSPLIGSTPRHQIGKARKLVAGALLLVIFSVGAVVAALVDDYAPLLIGICVALAASIALRRNDVGGTRPWRRES